MLRQNEKTQWVSMAVTHKSKSMFEQLSTHWYYYPCCISAGVWSFNMLDDAPGF